MAYNIYHWNYNVRFCQDNPRSCTLHGRLACASRPHDLCYRGVQRVTTPSLIHGYLQFSEDGDCNQILYRQMLEIPGPDGIER